MAQAPAECLISGLDWRKAPQIFPDLIANALEHGEPLLRTLHGGGVLKVVMDRDGLAGKKRAALFGVVTHGQDVIELLAGEFIGALGTLAGNIDAQLPHGGNCFGSNLTRLGSGAEHLEAIAGVVTQEAFGHLAPG